MKGSCTNLWSLEYISLIYLYKHHYLFFLYKSKEIFFRNNRLLPYVYFYVWFHCIDIIALVWSNPSSISNWTSIESCFVCKNKISWFSNSSYFFAKTIRFFFNRSLRYIVKTFGFHTYSSEKLNILESLHCLFWLLFRQIFCLTTQKLKGHYLFQDISWLFRKLTCLYYFFLIQVFMNPFTFIYCFKCPIDGSSI